LSDEPGHHRPAVAPTCRGGLGGRHPFTTTKQCLGVWGKGQERVGAAVHRVRQRLPFPLLGLDSDNGSEFINQHLYTYCRRQGITFTRSRSDKKNDSCHVEQKNPDKIGVVRRLVGYDRYSSRAALEALNQVYDLLHLDVNFFQSVMKLVVKTRHGAKVHKVYGMARTPYQRLLWALAERPPAQPKTITRRSSATITYDVTMPVR